MELSLEEIIYLLNNKRLDGKCNNYILEGLTDYEIETILKNIKEIIPFNHTSSLEVFAERIKITNLKNLVFNMEDEEVTYLLNRVFNLLEIDKKLVFSGPRDLFRFNNILKRHNQSIQLIMYNVEKIEEEKQKLINEIFAYYSVYFNINYLVKEDNDLVTYQTINGTIIDFREDYTKIKVCR